MSPIDFYFDFSSPYGYLASEKIDELAARYGRQVNWHPILLGAVFKVTGGVPLVQWPLKGDYYRHDFARSARYLGVPFTMPETFPLATQAAARAYYWLEDQDRQLARNFAHACYRAYFAEGIDISDVERLLVIATSMGVDGEALKAALNDPAVKERLKTENDQAIARGVCGSPFYIVDGEPFWGSDRLPQLEKWLETGGF
ncbi:MAG: 2-hydroxychromene-2-carboxylate isomerase [Pseudomonadota bacterium]